MQGFEIMLMKFQSVVVLPYSNKVLEGSTVCVSSLSADFVLKSTPVPVRNS
jgi:hypothetical protein